jgi:DNA repair protein RAD16
MVRETRSRARKASPPPSSAATPDPAPLFSARTSNGTATPTTADGGEDAPPKRATRGRKRAVSEDLDGEEDVKPVTKRKRVFVELPARPSRANNAVTVSRVSGISVKRTQLTVINQLASNKKKGKAPERSDVEMIPHSEEEDEVVEAPSTRSKGKGKAKAAPVVRIFALPLFLFFSLRVQTPSVSAKSKGKRKAVTPPSDEEELDYDENEALAESDASGSEFEASDAGSAEEAPSDDDQPAAAKSRKSPRKARPAAVLDADDVEAAMLQAAVRASLGEDAEAGDGAAGPSYDPSIENLPSESEALSSDLSEADDDDDEDDAPTKKTTKGKKALAALAKSHSYAEGGNVMTLTKLKKKQREERKNKKSARSIIRAEEQELVKKLGRRLIQVRTVGGTSRIHAERCAQSEKNTIRLLREHPELKGVWDELETGVKPTTPQKAEQPKNLKVTLLPFQQESLFWMRAQEASVWKGGLLAVCPSPSSPGRLMLMCAGRDGYGKDYSNYLAARLGRKEA